MELDLSCFYFWCNNQINPDLSGYCFNVVTLHLPHDIHIKKYYYLLKHIILLSSDIVFKISKLTLYINTFYYLLFNIVIKVD
jgi:hypothetical protein